MIAPLLCILTAKVTAQKRSCGPFELVSISGRLFETPEGHLFPGPDFTNLPGTVRFYIDDEGTLTNDKFEPCTFTNAFQCGPHIKADKSFNLTMPYGELSWRGNTTVYLCPPQAVHTTGLPTTTWTATASPPPWPEPTGSPPYPPLVGDSVRYFEPWTATDMLDIIDHLKEWPVEGCLLSSIQAPYCRGDDEPGPFPTWRDFPLPTPTARASVASSTVNIKDDKVMEAVMEAAAVVEDILLG